MDYQKNQQLIEEKSSSSSKKCHVTAVFLHIFFKGLSFLTYSLTSLFLNRAYEFLFTTVLIAIDFWVVKNLTGRFLVGLKWWSTINQRGNQKWKFLGSKNKKFSAADKTFFYLGLFIYPICWTALMVLQLLTIDALELLLTFVGMFISSINLVGYYKCYYFHKRQMNLKREINECT